MGGDILEFLLAALALYLIVEGSILALFPDILKRAIALVPEPTLRKIGIGFLLTGMMLAWLFVRG